MHGIKEIFDAIDNALDLEMKWSETKNKKQFIYVVFIWSDQVELAEWRTFSAFPNLTKFIGKTIISLYPKGNCPFFVGINPLGYENNENNLEKLTFLLSLMRNQGIVFQSIDDNENPVTGI